MSADSQDPDHEGRTKHRNVHKVAQGAQGTPRYLVHLVVPCDI